MKQELNFIEGDDFTCHKELMQVLQFFDLEYDCCCFNTSIKVAAVSENDCIVVYGNDMSLTFSRMENTLLLTLARPLSIIRLSLKYYYQINTTEQELRNYIAKYNKLKAFA